jgi:hypothetical protein
VPSLRTGVRGGSRCLRRFWGHILWNPVWGEFISIPKGVIGMAQLAKTSCEDKSGAVPGSHSEWRVVIGSRRMARSAGM